jgi:hypothetical protein
VLRGSGTCALVADVKPMRLMPQPFRIVGLYGASSRWLASRVWQYLYERNVPLVVLTICSGRPPIPFFRLLYHPD